MASNRSYVTENTSQRERLKSLVARLSDAQLDHRIPTGWTVAGVLMHLAFWDQRIVLLVEQWRKAGVAGLPSALNDADVDWINDAAKPLLLAVPPRTAAELALAIAEAVDRAVEALPDEFVAANEKAGGRLNLNRANHRRTHLDEIEQSLK